MKKVVNLGRVLDKSLQRKIIGGTSYKVCRQEYHGPYFFNENECEKYFSLPDKFKVCVSVSDLCFNIGYLE